MSTPVQVLDDDHSREEKSELLTRQNHGMKRLVTAVQELSLARSLDAVIEVVRIAARDLTGADGATFVLRDGDRCYYLDENAIGPLWKGQRFPMHTCISGWAMLNRQAAAIEDIYADPRIPTDAYRPTFVKSLVMVPIRVEQPIGAIGNYWAKKHKPTPDEVELLQALANTVSVAIENVQLYADLEQRVLDRTAQLKAANCELESFSYSVSHDLRAPLRHIHGFATALKEDYAGSLDEAGKSYLERICSGATRMSSLIDDLLRLSSVVRMEISQQRVDLSAIAHELATRMQTAEPQRQMDICITDGMEARGDAGLLRIALDNLLSNAWKYSSKQQQATIEFSSRTQPEGGLAFFVRDNGAGFDMQYAQRLFGAFQRLHTQEDFPGSGVGLATVQRIIHRHLGRIWAEGEPGKGATFYFTLPEVKERCWWNITNAASQGLQRMKPASREAGFQCMLS